MGVEVGSGVGVLVTVGIAEGATVTVAVGTTVGAVTEVHAAKKNTEVRMTIYNRFTFNSLSLT